MNGESLIRFSAYQNDEGVIYAMQLLENTTNVLFKDLWMKLIRIADVHADYKKYKRAHRKQASKKDGETADTNQWYIVYTNKNQHHLKLKQQQLNA